MCVDDVVRERAGGPAVEPGCVLRHARRERSKFGEHDLGLDSCGTAALVDRAAAVAAEIDVVSLKDGRRAVVSGNDVADPCVGCSGQGHSATASIHEAICRPPDLL